MLTYNQEILRKIVHLSNLIIPLLLYYNDKNTILYFLIPVTILFVSVDILRIKTKFVKNIYDTLFSSITRSNEDKKLTGASYVFLSSSIIIFFFEVQVAIISLLIMSISDTMAALFGRKYGKIVFFRKTLEGSAAFFLSSLIIVILASDSLFILAIFSITITTIVEAYSFYDIDDNLMVPLTYALSYSILGII